MAKTYDFKIVVRRCEFDRGFKTIPYGLPKYIYSEANVHTTLKEAIALRDAAVAKETRGCAGFLSMRYRNDRKAPGIGKVEPLYKEGD